MPRDEWASEGFETIGAEYQAEIPGSRWLTTAPAAPSSAATELGM